MTRISALISMPIWKQIMLGMVLGGLAGPFLSPVIDYIEVLGKGFIEAIKIAVLPLIFLSIVTGIASIGNVHKMGRIGFKTLAWYFLTTSLAIPIGLALGLILQPGIGLELSMSAQDAQSVSDYSPSFSLLALIPSNPFASFASGDAIQVIIFAILIGVAATMVGEQSKAFISTLESANAVINKLIELIIKVAPIGVFALIAVVTNSYGFDVILPLLKLIIAIYIGCVLHTVCVLGGLIRIVSGLGVVTFLKGIFEAQIMAFSTTSAAATLPVTMRCSEHNHGVDKEVSRFVLPIGATVNMDGTALYQALCAVFIAQAYGITLGPAELVTIFLTTILASIGTAAVPAAGLVVLSVVLSSVGLPLEGIALVAGIDRILDMARTTVNITGDATVALLVASSENSVDQQVFLQKAE